MNKGQVSTSAATPDRQAFKVNRFLFLLVIIIVSFTVGLYVGAHSSIKTAFLPNAKNAEQKTPVPTPKENINLQRIELIKELDRKTTISEKPNYNWVPYSPQCAAIKDHFIGKLFKGIYYPSSWKVNEDPTSSDMVNDKQKDYECTIMFGYPNVGGRQAYAGGQIAEIRITADYEYNATRSAQESVTSQYEVNKEAMGQFNMDLEFDVEKIYLGNNIDAVKVISSQLSAQDYEWNNQNFPELNGNYMIIIKDGDREFEISLTSFGLHSQNLTTFKDFIDKLKYGNGSLSTPSSN